MLIIFSFHPGFQMYQESKMTFASKVNEQCSELCSIIGFQGTRVSYFGISVTKIYTTQEDYKPVFICVHCRQIPIYIAVMSNCIQLQIISVAYRTYVSFIYDPNIGYLHRSFLATLICASFMSRLANTGDIDRPIYGSSAQGPINFLHYLKSLSHIPSYQKYTRYTFT